MKQSVINGKPLWKTTKNSNIEIIQPLQNKILHVSMDAPWYVIDIEKTST